MGRPPVRFGEKICVFFRISRVRRWLFGQKYHQLPVGIVTLSPKLDEGSQAC